ncbi:MAG: DEAD/DEAH box helicase [Actinomycetota bacterium]|nr:MAG: DEAD/DEAH box helicase [Actinomycetota bacterium]
MSSPAERYAASRVRAADARTQLAAFRGMFDFGLDPFQEQACRALEAGHGVLVAAPTGAGKTVVGEFAVHLALAEGRKCFYTTPIKALSNQKYHDLVERYGAAAVGLLTGDNAINGEAPVVVMTTEVLRNMLYAGSATLDHLSYVVMDEVHYLADRSRGAVWEEVIIHLPERVTVVALSATVSNAEEFGEWLGTVRGDTTVVVEEHRPVPLWQHVIAGQRLLDLFVDDDQEHVNPELVRIAREAQRDERLRDTRSRHGRRGGRRHHGPSRADVITRLDREGLLPAITFIFSRAGCDAAVSQCLAAGIRLTTPAERIEIRDLVEQRCADIPDEDLAVLGYGEWLTGLERGIAAHHAGMLPTFKEVVEELFQRGWVKAVFATETLALGINMPARSVVLERLVKWNGEAHVDVTPGEYTQLTGRAGRRGIDVEGHAVVLWAPQLDPRTVAGLASARTYPLRSSFRPSYNMAVNLVSRLGRHASREVLETSFAQFQADRAVVGLAAQVRRNTEALDGYRAAMTCHLGDFAAYADLRHELTRRERELARHGAARRRTATTEALARLRPGDVIFVPSGRRAGPAVVLDPGLDAADGDPRPFVLTADRQTKRLSVVDFPIPVEPVDRLRIPRSFNARSATARKDLAAALRARVADVPPPRRTRSRSDAGDDAAIADLRSRIRQHPCHGCDEREHHARWAERYYRLRRETDDLQRRVEGRTNSIARQFDRVCQVLEALGYLHGEGDQLQVTADGLVLARLYSESDLLAAQCLRDGAWDGLTPPELAAACSALVYESRQADDAAPPRLPGGRAREAVTALQRTWAELEAVEAEHGLAFVREPDLGFCWAAYRWASGHRLDAVLADADLTPGDFVRWAKQVVDLLGQIAVAAGPHSPTGAAARTAGDAMVRGVVARSSVG